MEALFSIFSAMFLKKIPFLGSKITQTTLTIFMIYMIYKMLVSVSISVGISQCKDGLRTGTVLANFGS